MLNNGASTGEAQGDVHVSQRTHSSSTAPTSAVGGGGYGGTGQFEMPPMSRTGSAQVHNSNNNSNNNNDDGYCVIADEERSRSSSWKAKVEQFLRKGDPSLLALLKWGLSILFLLFLGFLVFGMLYSGVHYSSNCTANHNVTGGTDLMMPGYCHTRFGTIIGVFQDTYAYSNCNDDYMSTSDSYINLTVPVTSAGQLTTASKEFYSGLQWQCVEFARRYWMINGKPEPAYFGSVDWAADIWNLTVVHLLANTTQTLPLHRYKSGDRVVGDGLKAPEVGDIIIYPVQGNGFPVGHVAVITKVDLEENGSIYIAEQNWGSSQWPGPFHNYSRKIPLHYDLRTTAITLNDPAGKIIGWMRYG